jgi:hypothetical protein
LTPTYPRRPGKDHSAELRHQRHRRPTQFSGIQTHCEFHNPKDKPIRATNGQKVQFQTLSKSVASAEHFASCARITIDADRPILSE